MDILVELSRGSDRDTLAYFWGLAPGLVDRAFAAIEAAEVPAS